MQNYKIRIPNVDISRQVQEKAFKLGHTWASGDRVIRYTERGLLVINNNYGIYSPDSRLFDGLLETEISYQDFLRLGEIDVNNCKIRLIRQNLVSLNSKLLDLGVKGYANRNEYVQINNPVRDLWGPTLSIIQIPNACHPDFMVIRNGRTIMIGTEQYFNQLPEKELTVAQIMQLQPTINNTTTEEIMSGEITLKCITAPQKAKNITVDRDYTGILIDSDDSQVDTLREATHFRCVNNNGIEAKYKLALFAQPEPPRPQFPTWEQIESGIYVNDNNEVVIDFNDEEHVIYDNEVLEINSGMSCCGLNEISGIQRLHNNIDRNCRFDLLEDSTNRQRLKDFVFKSLVNNAIEENRGSFRIFTLVSGHDDIDTLMKEIMVERGGVETEYRRSTSSSNDIKVFVINL
jgi:hypothetical protein